MNGRLKTIWKILPERLQGFFLALILAVTIGLSSKLLWFIQSLINNIYFDTISSIIYSLLYFYFVIKFMYKKLVYYKSLKYGGFN